VPASSTLTEFKTLLETSFSHIINVALHHPDPDGVNIGDFTEVGQGIEVDASLLICGATELETYELDPSGTFDTDTSTTSTIENTVIITYVELAKNEEGKAKMENGARHRKLQFSILFQFIKILEILSNPHDLQIFFFPIFLISLSRSLETINFAFLHFFTI